MAGPPVTAAARAGHPHDGETLQRLGIFVAGLRRRGLPADLQALLAERVLDTLAAQLHGVQAGHAARLLAVLDAPGPAVVWGTADRRSLRDATAANAALAHATWFEDGSRYTGGHPASAVIPAALVLAAERGVDGAGLLAAIAAGYEVFLRLGRAIYPATVQRGFQSTAVLAAPATAAAAAVLLALDPMQAAQAIAIACSQGAGLKEALRCADSQPLQVGRSCEGGLTAARLAALGATGSPFILERGFLRAFAGDVCIDGVTDGLDGGDVRWSIGETYMKRHGGCRGNHAPADAALELAAAHGLAPADVAGVEVAVDGVTRAAAIEPPADASEAASSIGYSIAVALVHGDLAPPRFSAGTLADPRVQRLLRITRVEADPALDAGYPARRAAVVRLRLADGRELVQRVERARGEPEWPLEPGHAAAKFDAVAAPIYGASAAAALREQVLALPSAPGVAPIAERLVRPAQPGSDNPARARGRSL